MKEFIKNNQKIIGLIILGLFALWAIPKFEKTIKNLVNSLNPWGKSEEEKKKEEEKKANKPGAPPANKTADQAGKEIGISADMLIKLKNKADAIAEALKTKPWYILGWFEDEEDAIKQLKGIDKIQFNQITMYYFEITEGRSLYTDLNKYLDEDELMMLKHLF